MATTPPPAISGLPAAPDPNDRSTFNTRAYPWAAALPTLSTEIAAVATNVKANADDAKVNADIAVAQVPLATAQVALATAQAGLSQQAAASAGSIAWLSGTTYAVGDLRYSPLNFQTYRRKTAGAGTTDPSADAAGWVLMNVDSVPIDSYALLTGSENLVTSKGEWLKTGVLGLRADYPASELEGYVAGSVLTSPAGRSVSAIAARLPATLSGITLWPYSTGVISFNGTSWGEANVTNAGSVSTNGSLFLSSRTSSANTSVSTSPDGITWTPRTVPSSIWHNVGITGAFLIHNFATAVNTSSDGVTWATQTLPAALTHIATGPTLALYTSTTSSTYYTSTTLTSWTSRTLPFAAVVGGSVAYGDGLFFVCEKTTVGATIYSSPDGINWTARGVTPVAITLGSAVLQNGLWFLGDSAGGTSIITPDGFASPWLYSTRNPPMITVKLGATQLITPSGSSSVATYAPAPAGLVGSETNTTASVAGKTLSYYKRVG